MIKLSLSLYIAAHGRCSTSLSAYRHHNALFTQTHQILLEAAGQRGDDSLLDPVLLLVLLLEARPLYDFRAQLPAPLPGFGFRDLLLGVYGLASVVGAQGPATPTRSAIDALHLFTGNAY